MASKKVKIALGCLVASAVVLIVLALIGGVLLKKIGSNLEDGKISFTDPKTGATLNVGDGKLPENFPSDFPLYPNAKITSSLGGNGYWLTLATDDPLPTVEKYYDVNLREKGWKVNQTSKEEEKISWTVSKNNLNGYLIIDTSEEQTTIVVVIGETQAQE